MPAPSARLREQLSAPGLLRTVRQCFEPIPDHRRRRGTYSLSDGLMTLKRYTASPAARAMRDLIVERFARLPEVRG